jgi:hypothetical protein
MKSGTWLPPPVLRLQSPGLSGGFSVPVHQIPRRVIKRVLSHIPTCC